MEEIHTDEDLMKIPLPLLYGSLTWEHCGGQCHRKDNHGGLQWYDKWIELQKKYPDWRPVGYYEALSNRYKGSKDVWEICTEIGWYEALRQIVVGYLRQTERGEWYEEMNEIENYYVCEVLDIGNSSVLIMLSDTCSSVLMGFEDYGLPEDLDINCNFYRSMLSDLEKKIDKHWICEMYAMFVISGDCAHCTMIPWNFQHPGLKESQDVTTKQTSEEIINSNL